MSISLITESQAELYTFAPQTTCPTRAALGADMTRVLIICGQPAVRKSLRKRFAAEADLTVVGEAKDSQVAVDLTASLSPDVVLMDIDMPLDDAMMSALCAICRHTPVVFTAMYDDIQAFTSARDAGVSPFEAKPVPFDILLTTIRQVVH
jgi:DNA-binding NarL/FixJ family response regulator